MQGVTANWELLTIPLDLTILEGQHSGKNLSKAFIDVLSDYGLLDKVISITSDNATNMDTFFENFGNEIKLRVLILI